MSSGRTPEPRLDDEAIERFFDTGWIVRTALFSLDEMTPDSGALQFIPGSSQWGRVDFGDHDYDDPDYNDPDHNPRAPPKFRREDAVTITASPGDVLFFGPCTAHASFENTSQQYRRMLINGYAYPGANGRDYSGEGACRTISVA